MRTFVCGDLHGNFKALKEVLSKASFDPENDTLITLGDYIDGGPHIEVQELLEFLLDLPNWIGVIGNHDYWMLETIEAGWESIMDDEWLVHGGEHTLKSLGVEYEQQDDRYKLLNRPSEKVFEFFKRLEYYHIDRKSNLLVHAGYDHIKNDITSHNFESLDILYCTIWDREFWENAHSFKTDIYKNVFIGHSWSLEYPMLRGQVWNLDSGAGHYGKLSLMEIDSTRIWKSSRTATLYNDFGLR